jgi:hypothetical protein
MKTVTALFVAGVVAIGTAVALAQEGLHTGRKSGVRAPPAAENTKGTESSIPAGQADTAARIRRAPMLGPVVPSKYKVTDCSTAKRLPSRGGAFFGCARMRGGNQVIVGGPLIVRITKTFTPE